MCLAVPLRVVEITGATGRVEQNGVSRTARLDLLPDVQLGDYVLVHAGVAIQKVDPQEALETLRMMRLLADEVR